MTKIQVGDVIKIFNRHITPAKTKYSLCVSPNLFFLINTEARTEYECLAIKKRDNSFLGHDSYISCNFAFLYENVELANAEMIGSVSNNDLQALREHIKNNVRRLRQQDKDKIVSAIDDELLSR